MIYSGKWALVTGASSGIGEAFADALADRGANLVLVARRAERLHAIAARLRAARNVEALVIVADLSKPEATARITEDVAKAGARVDILVNNAGYGQPGHFGDIDWIHHRGLIDLMATSYAQLVHVFLPGMQARGFGRIINVASVAGLVPGGAGHTLYGAVKAFLVSFSQSLAAENAGTGVKVSALCPGLTRSEFHDVNNTRAVMNTLPGFMFMEAEAVAARAVDAVERGHVVYVPGMWNKALVWALSTAPRSWAASLVAAQSRKIRARPHGDVSNVKETRAEGRSG